MQNLSLQMSQAAPQNKAERSAGKTHAGSDKPTSAEQNTSFQQVLSKQVQAQQTPAKQEITQPAKVQQTSAKVMAENNVETVAPQAKRKAKSINSQHDIVAIAQGISDDKKTNMINTDFSLASHPNSISIEQNKTDSDAALATKVEVESKTEDTSFNAQDDSTTPMSVAALVPVMISIAQVNTQAVSTATEAKLTLSTAASAPVMSSIPLVNTQAVSSETVPKLTLSTATPVPLMNKIPQVNKPAFTTPTEAKLTSQIATIVESQPNKQYDLDAMLNNAMSQSKNVNTAESSTVEPKMTLSALRNTDKTGQLDVMLPSMAKLTAVDGSTNAKLMLSTLRENMAKDTGVKDVLIPAGLPSLAQVNTAVPTQQAASANMIHAYPGKAGWDQAISQKVVWMVGAGEQSATLTLNPPDLGPLQVVIHVHNDQADTTFISNNAEVRQALQDGMANLRDKMSESGLQLGQANVSSGQQSQQPFQQAMQGRQAPQVSNVNTVLPTEKTIDANTIVRISNGLVDTFA